MNRTAGNLPARFMRSHLPCRMPQRDRPNRGSDSARLLTEPGFLIMMLSFMMGQYQTGPFHLSSQTKDHSGGDRTLLGRRM